MVMSNYSKYYNFRLKLNPKRANRLKLLKPIFKTKLRTLIFSFVLLITEINYRTMSLASSLAIFKKRYDL